MCAARGVGSHRVLRPPERLAAPDAWKPWTVPGTRAMHEALFVGLTSCSVQIMARVEKDGRHFGRQPVDGKAKLATRASEVCQNLVQICRLG